MKGRTDADFHWREEGRTLLSDCHIFSVYKARRISPEGKTAERFFLDAPDWVTVIPLLEKGGGSTASWCVSTAREAGA